MDGKDDEEEGVKDTKESSTGPAKPIDGLQIRRKEATCSSGWEAAGRPGQARGKQQQQQPWGADDESRPIRSAASNNWMVYEYLDPILPYEPSLCIL